MRILDSAATLPTPSVREPNVGALRQLVPPTAERRMSLWRRFPSPAQSRVLSLVSSEGKPHKHGVRGSSLQAVANLSHILRACCNSVDYGGARNIPYSNQTYTHATNWYPAKNSIKMITTVIFDLDGLLMDTEPLWHQARVELFKGFGLVWSESDQEQCMGLSTAGWVAYMVRRLDGRLSPQKVQDETVGRMAQYYANGLVRILPGAQGALEFSYEKFKLGLASGSYRQLLEAAVKGAGWTKFFAAVVSSDDVPRGKPAPDVYLEIAKRMGVRMSETVVVEDSANGILAGLAAGAKAIAVPNLHIRPPQEILNKATVVIDSLTLFPQAIAKLTAGMTATQ
jgi:HAD superfamily hydrolase (TIGR01509 family)